jgi:Tfp pilus assembly protein PilP
MTDVSEKIKTYDFCDEAHVFSKEKIVQLSICKVYAPREYDSQRSTSERAIKNKRFIFRKKERRTNKNNLHPQHQRTPLISPLSENGC